MDTSRSGVGARRRAAAVGAAAALCGAGLVGCGAPEDPAVPPTAEATTTDPGPTTSDGGGEPAAPSDGDGDPGDPGDPDEDPEDPEDADGSGGPTEGEDPAQPVAVPAGWEGTLLGTPGLPPAEGEVTEMVTARALYDGSTELDAAEAAALGGAGELEYFGLVYDLACETGTELGGDPAVCVGTAGNGQQIPVRVSVVTGLFEHPLQVTQIGGRIDALPERTSFPAGAPVVWGPVDSEHPEMDELSGQDAEHALVWGLLMSQHPDGDPEFSAEADCELSEDHRFARCTAESSDAADDRVPGTWFGSAQYGADGGTWFVFGREG